MPKTSANDEGVLGRIVGWYSRSMMFLGCTMLVGIVLIMGCQVYFRYVLNDSLIWAEEMCRYLLIWMTFLFMGLAYERGEMISLTMVLRKVPPWLHLGLMTIAYVASIGTLGILVWYGFAFANVNSIQTMPAFDFIWSALINPDEEANFSSWWLYASIPVGAFLLAIHLVAGYLLRARRILAGEPVYPEDISEEIIGSGSR